MKTIIKTVITVIITAFLTNQAQAQTATNKIDSTGNVGIGTLSPLSLFHVNGLATFGGRIDARISGGAINQRWARTDSGINWNLVHSGNRWSLFETGGNDVTIGLDAGSVDRGNALGIGTAAGAYRLNVNGTTRISGQTTSESDIKFSGAINSFLGIDAEQDVNLKFGTGSGSEARMYLYGITNGQANAGDVFIGTASNVGDITLKGQVNVALGMNLENANKDVSIGNYSFFGRLYSGADTFIGHNVRSASSDIRKLEVQNSNWYGHAMRMYHNEGITFYTSSSTLTAGDKYWDSSTETHARMRIDINGNVGIGTNSPAAKLHLDNSTNDTATLLNTVDAGSNAGTHTHISLDNANGNIGQFRTVGNDFQVQATNSSGDIDFLTGGSNQRMKITNDGNVGIGTTTPDSKLTVAGTVKSKEIIVEETAGADFVFEEDYDLPTLAQIETFIKANKHLEGIASAEEMKANGVKVGELQIQLLQKIEELTLYVIKQEKKSKAKDSTISELFEMNKELLKRIEKLEKKEGQ